MKARVLLGLLAPMLLHAQLALFAVEANGAETPLGATYNGAVAAGDSKELRLRARNTGSTPIPVTRLAISGAGFSITSPAALPPAVAPGNAQDIVILFAGGPPASYSANFQINSVSVLLIVISAPEPALSVVAGCTGPDTITRAIDLGKITLGQSNNCTLALRNSNAVAVTLSVLALTGSGFQIVQGLRIPLILLPGETAAFIVNFAPPAASAYTGMLTVGSRVFPLTGTGLNPPLPAPILEIDPGAVSSGQQRTLTMRLPGKSPVAASGSVNLSFQPDGALTDPGVMFLATGARSISFGIQPGDTQILLGGQPGALFQTGTSSGKLRFTISANVNLAGDPTVVLTIPPAPVAIDTATATQRLGNLDINIRGFDNTYSAGGMAFTFYDLAGGVVAPGKISADFAADFRNYFTQTQSGSAFLMRVTFPVTGDAAQIGGVDVQMANAAGTAVVQRLVFK